MAFRATISLQLDVQSHHLFSFMTFRVVLFSLAFRVVVHSGRFLEGHVSPQEWSSNNGILPVKRSGGFAKEGIS
uniref:Uncharacterized protein n=1 Tax=Vitis vinifera TaxID=29760 RepID=F6HXK0_VITVI